MPVPSVKVIDKASLTSTILACFIVFPSSKSILVSNLTDYTEVSFQKGLPFGGRGK
jgi:hypothetical protein